MFVCLLLPTRHVLLVARGAGAGSGAFGILYVCCTATLSMLSIDGQTATAMAGRNQSPLQEQLKIIFFYSVQLGRQPATRVTNGQLRPGK
jgi:hypothetical protein